MQQSGYDEFVVMLDSIAMIYGKGLPHTVIRWWWEALEGYDLPAIHEGLNRHIRNLDTGQFMPKPADIVRMLGGTTQDGALIAWSKVDRAVRGVGTYQSVVFDDPIIHAVIADMGGWVALGNKTEHEWPFVAREFENRYRGYRTRGQIENYPPVLVGMAQVQNETQGFAVAEPVLIGDKAQALRTREFGSQTPRVQWHRPDVSKVAAALPVPDAEPPVLRLHND